MKNKILSLAIIAVVTFTGLSFTTKDEVKKDIKIEKSNVVWKGYQVTGSQKGVLALKSGFLNFKADKLIGGKFTIDMTTITSTDQSGEYKQKLEGHLKSDDFFSVKTHPTATLVFNKVKHLGKNSYSVTGDLTIKGITNSINFEISIYGKKASASLKIDRAKYNVRYGSTSFFDNLKDKAIYDEFDLIVDLEF
ncbi:Rhodanese-like domain protein [hydrothermal vent metagenome]|jgi:polyisoprenoid-binding protein YceI|uniref:Rhodanese-like domain protein n=1 Tax=hydrothermal vent metagenome TaxID=652676 RepID=A0A3B0QZR2_9ZZZZ